jgi:nucleotide-binding universal stress UspA family protein
MKERKKRILVGVDGSEDARRALLWAIDHARELRAEIVAVHAVELPPYLLAGHGAPTTTAFDQEWREDITSRFQTAFDQEWRDSTKNRFQDQWLRPLKDSGVPYRAVVGDGDPAAVLTQAAEEQDVDMMVLGRRGLGGFPDLLLGSVSEKVTHHSRRPVVLLSP